MFLAVSINLAGELQSFLLSPESIQSHYIDLLFFGLLRRDSKQNALCCQVKGAGERNMWPFHISSCSSRSTGEKCLQKLRHSQVLVKPSVDLDFITRKMQTGQCGRGPNRSITADIVPE